MENRYNSFRSSYSFMKHFEICSPFTRFITWSMTSPLFDVFQLISWAFWRAITLFLIIWNTFSTGANWVEYAGRKKVFQQPFDKYSFTLDDLWVGQLSSNKVILLYPKFALELIHYIRFSQKIKNLIRINVFRCCH